MRVRYDPEGAVEPSDESWKPRSQGRAIAGSAAVFLGFGTWGSVRLDGRRREIDNAQPSRLDMWTRGRSAPGARSVLSNWSPSRDVAWWVQGTRRTWMMSLLVRLLGAPLGLAYGGCGFRCCAVSSGVVDSLSGVGVRCRLGVGAYIQIGLVKRMFRVRRVLCTLSLAGL